MMIFGMLYFDETYKLNEVELIEKARLAFERKNNSKASLALVSMREDVTPMVEGLTVTRSHLVRPHQTIVGVITQADQCNKIANLEGQCSDESLQPRAKKAANPKIQ